MKFRTEIKTDRLKKPVAPGARLLLMGSCFSEHMAGRLRESGFNVLSNPFGNVYNPLSLLYLLKRIREKKGVQPEEMFENEGLWHSFDFHSRFSGMDCKETMKKMNSQIDDAASFLKRTDILFLTFGSARAFFRKDTDMPVNNCHKLPARNFDHRLLSVLELEKSWKKELENIKKINPDLRIVFTVSPVRYLKDGFFANSLSKARLIEFIYRLQEELGETEYFPAYEIFMDDLRDYRFYDSNLTHPSEMGIKYVWEKWLDQFSDNDTRLIIARVQRIVKGLSHRPAHPASEVHRQFMKQLKKEWILLKEGYPGLHLPEIDQ